MSIWPEDSGIPKMVEELYGDYETDLLRKMWSKAIAHQENFIVAYREDLSYNPPE